MFLLISREFNCPATGWLEVSTKFDKGQVVYNPFFVIDPFDRSCNPLNNI